MPIDVLFATRPCLRTNCSRGCRAEPGREPDQNPVNDTDSLPFGTRPCPRSASVDGPRAKVPIEALFATRPCLRTICSRGCRAKPGREPDYNPVNGTDSLSFGTRPCPKSASVEGRRAEDRPEDPLCHARMPLRYLWVGSPCQSADRSPLRHAGISLRYLWKGSPCQRPVRASVSCRSLTGRLALCHARMPLRHP